MKGLSGLFTDSLPKIRSFYLRTPRQTAPRTAPQILWGLWVTNIKISQHAPTPPLATAQSSLQTWSSTTIPVPDPSKHTELTLCTIIVVLIQVEWKLLTRGQWGDNDAQRMVVMPCFMCVEVAMWCRAKMWKWGGTAKTISLSRGDVHQVTSHASC